MPKLKTFIVSTRETVFTDYIIKAKNESEAQRKVEMGECHIPEPTDSANFEIISVIEETEAK